jgi:hypothetical protein
MSRLPRVDPVLEIAPDRKSLIMTFPSDPPICVRMDLAAVELTLETLGLLRTGMVPEVPQEWAKPDNEPVSARRISEPGHIIARRDALAGDIIVQVRDPRFGWLVYIINKGVARAVAERIIAECNMPAPAMSGRA